jgi:superfamily II DNA/RNA helicase
LANRRAQPHQPLGLVLVPTRELAMQVTDALAPFAQAVGLDIRLIAGGMPYARQIDALRRAVPVLVATPGRLNDLIAQGHVRLSDVEVTVLDEADQMCDMGFAPQITEVLDLTPPTGQRLLFSATLDGDVDAIVRRYLNHPIMHSTVSGEARVDTMEHFLFVVHSEDKPQVVARIASRAGKTMLFGRTQLGVERIAKELMHQGVACGALHGGKSQAVRTKTLQQFKDGVTSVLVATDVAARGIHVEGVSLVVHVDPPKDPKDYVHRAGRTARAGAAGAVVTIVGPRQQKSVLAMMTRAGVTPEVVRIRLTSPELGVITGARQPSGVPWHPPAARTAQRGRRAASQGGRRRPVARPAKTRISG